MRERDIEKVLVDEVRKAGGRAYKFTSPGNDGVPDRIVLLPSGQIIFVELKTEVGRLTRLQRIQCERIKSLGQKVRVLHGLNEVADFFQEAGLTDAAERTRKRLARCNDGV